MILKTISRKLARLFPHLDRRVVANYYLKGKGIEIGALHNPVKLSSQAKVKYVDRLNNEDLLKQYPDLKKSKLVKIDYVADGELLESVTDNSQDFVISSHFIEHCQNPILAIENQLRVLKVNGIIFMAVPDKRFSFDKDRSVTTIEHLVNDYHSGTENSKLDHFKDWIRHVDKIEDTEKADERLNQLLNIDYSIHFHVWALEDFLSLLIYLKNKMNFTFAIELVLRRGMENIIILKKI